MLRLVFDPPALQNHLTRMPSTKPRPKTIDEYLARAKPEQRAALERLHKTIHDVAPNVEEGIGYGLAGFKLNGRSLVYFGAWANHCAFYPGSSTLTKKFQRQLKDFETSKGTIRFTPDKPLPATLVKKLVKARIVENVRRSAKRE